MKWFWWSDSEDNPPPYKGDKIFLVFPGHIPHWELDTLYNPEGYEFWQFSERAKKYYWTKWGGVNDDGEEVRLPQYNWTTEELRNEVKNVIEFWMETGIDGIVIDPYLDRIYLEEKITVVHVQRADVFTIRIEGELFLNQLHVVNIAGFNAKHLI